MNWKLFLSTFVLIFLAELGDKTQLTAMARAATGDGGKWTVFFAAGAALLLSTLIAVVFGSALTRVIPERYIKITAGILFLLFGGMILIQTLMPAKAEAKAEAKPPAAAPGVATRWVFRVAAQFEQASVDDYARLAKVAENPRVRELLKALAGDEADHLARVRRAEGAHGEAALPAQLETPPPPARVAQAATAQDADILERALAHEQATAAFYAATAQSTPLPALKHVFAALAAEEHEHAQRVESLIRMQS